MYQVLIVNWSAFLKGILPTIQCPGWNNRTHGGPIGQWGPIFANTGYVAHWCVIDHCVGIMAAHGVSLGVVFATFYPTYPTPPHPTPPHPTPHPSHPLPLLSILTAERDGKKYLEIEPSEIERLAIIKTNR